MPNTEEWDSSETEWNPDELSCQLCGVELMHETTMTVNGHPTCRECVAELAAEVAEKEASGSSVPVALVGAAIGGVLGAAVWAGIAIGSGWSIGYVAVLVGFLAGQGAKLAARGGHGQPLQIAAVAGAVFGLLAAKFAIYAHAAKPYLEEQAGAAISYFDSQILSTFPDALKDMSSAFDLLWIFLAVTAAWRVPATPQLELRDA
ncbi:MAG: hypothetical protein DHS20C15_31190 [Planctomycetota bacterium]|nr:MAG: hypothetical protein DHS20C15_31190 [Planctomycetota bacterium]